MFRKARIKMKFEREARVLELLQAGGYLKTMKYIVRVGSNKTGYWKVQDPDE